MSLGSTDTPKPPVSTDDSNPSCSTGTFVNLPSELKLMIMKHMPNVACLSNLIHASPEFWCCYKLAREDIFAAVTFQELKARGIVLDPSIRYLEVSLVNSNSFPHRYTHEAMQDIIHQLFAVKPVKLKIKECLRLLKLERMLLLGWSSDGDNGCTDDALFCWKPNPSRPHYGVVLVCTDQDGRATLEAVLSALHRVLNEDRDTGDQVVFTFWGLWTEWKTRVGVEGSDAMENRRSTETRRR